MPIPIDAALAHDALIRVDFSDAFEIVRPPDFPDDPQVWADALFRDPPRAVAVLLTIRNHLVRLVGIEQGDAHSFDTLRRSEREVLLGTDAGHLDFRASVLVRDDTVTLSTLATIHNRRGRLYMRVVAAVHPSIVRAMLRRAARSLSGGGARRRRAA